MYFIAFYFFEKDDKYVFKLEIRVVCKEYLAFKYVLIVFFGTNQMIIYVCTSEILKNHG